MIKNIFLFFIFSAALTNAQTATNENFLQNEIPKEQVYVHVNSSLLFSGEKLLYKFYCLDKDTNKLSDLSKIGWVIMLNAAKEEVFTHKLELEQGQSHSDFFIPSNLPSGAYKILGYTSWMLNAENNYFEQDIHILNPYQKENTGLLNKDSPEVITHNKTEISSEFDLRLNKNLFSTREEVVLSMGNAKEDIGDFSISVRRIDSLNKPKKIQSTSLTKLNNKTHWDFSDTLILPEIRGSLITGKITGKNNSKNLIVSFPGEENQVNIISVEENGEFRFHLNDGLAVDEILLQMVDHKQDDFSVELKPGLQPDFSQLVFQKPIIDKKYKEYILEHSINNQIENAYSATKADQTIFPKDEAYFFNGKLLKYNLDDYTRFSGILQTFVEIIEYGRIRRNSDGTHSILVRNQNSNGEFTLPALVIVDGVVLQNHDKLITFDVEKIESIGLLRSRFFFGPETFQGVVVVETKERNFPQDFREGYIKSSKIKTAENPKKYYSPNYNNKDLQRIPDYRYQLLWDPEVKSREKEDNLKFYTSDLKGWFEINLEGFTKEGQPISVSKTFKVN